MASPLDFRSSFPEPADVAYATLVDPAYLNARLAQLGGKNAALLEHHADAQGARYRLRHGIDSRDVPSALRSFLPGDLEIERSETWTRRGPGSYAGTVEVSVRGMPGSASGGMQLVDAAGGSEFRVDVAVSVNVPIFGGRIEGFVAEQIKNLLSAEVTFATEWMSKER
ncbi:DUF2505 domain-containing protein [Actinomycetes bacterium KLBMP 9759]